MKKDLIKYLAIFGLIVSNNVVKAEWTGIWAPGRDVAVQCNHWGWIDSNIYTVWPNACKPLQVRSSEQKVYSVDNTSNLCDEDEVAYFQYEDGDDKITLNGCMRHDLSKNIRKK